MPADGGWDLIRRLKGLNAFCPSVFSSNYKQNLRNWANVFHVILAK